MMETLNTLLCCVDWKALGLLLSSANPLYAAGLLALIVAVKNGWLALPGSLGRWLAPAAAALPDDPFEGHPLLNRLYDAVKAKFVDAAAKGDHDDAYHAVLTAIRKADVPPPKA